MTDAARDEVEDAANHLICLLRRGAASENSQLIADAIRGLIDAAILAAARAQDGKLPPLAEDWAAEADRPRAQEAEADRLDAYSELSDALGSDDLDSHASRLSRAKRLAAAAHAQDEAEPTLVSKSECLAFEVLGAQAGESILGAARRVVRERDEAKRNGEERAHSLMLEGNGLRRDLEAATERAEKAEAGMAAEKAGHLDTERTLRDALATERAEVAHLKMDNRFLLDDVRVTNSRSEWWADKVKATEADVARLTADLDKIAELDARLAQEEQAENERVEKLEAEVARLRCELVEFQANRFVDLEALRVAHVAACPTCYSPESSGTAAPREGSKSESASTTVGGGAPSRGEDKPATARAMPRSGDSLERQAPSSVAESRAARMERVWQKHLRGELVTPEEFLADQETEKADAAAEPDGYDALAYDIIASAHFPIGQDAQRAKLASELAQLVTAAEARGRVAGLSWAIGYGSLENDAAGIRNEIDRIKREAKEKP